MILHEDFTYFVILEKRCLFKRRQKHLRKSAIFSKDVDLKQHTSSGVFQVFEKYILYQLVKGKK